MKLEKLLCLKYFGSRSRANSAGRQTTNAVPFSFHEIISSDAGSSTSWYVLVKNGVGIVLLVSPVISPVFSTGEVAIDPFANHYT
ncbi:hypothetical protein HanIR_Chr00c28g0911561 [Helianthus annuus]|nr:hypothetical protein HanIR_Chr06g0258141 [Helianthus annuus]KAJ0629051.1 hypothetical protein HanIR_Chr00c28g0911561 [Helianthus annuus]